LIETLYQWDVAFFFWVNHGWSCVPLDYFFHFFNELKFFILPIVVFFLYMLLWGGFGGRFLILAFALAVLFTDQTVTNMRKHVFKRIRPCNVLTDVYTPYGPKASYSFPSNHAANIAAVMLLLSVSYRRWIGLFVAWALVVGLARIYLGHHYPSDVLGGYVVGLVMGFLALNISRFLMEKWKERHPAG
jgi:undecaprenyl-diphosphatase